MKPSTFLANLSILGVVAGIGLADPGLAQDQDPRKDATEATKAANDRLLDELPFSDTSDFESAKRGLIAPLSNDVVQTEDGNPVWDPQRFGFITEEAEPPDTANPSRS